MSAVDDLSETEVTECAEQLMGAARGAEPIERLVHEPTTVVDGYRIQAATHRLRTDRPVGWKAGCTSSAAQAMLQVESPLAGRYNANAVHDAPAQLLVDDFATAPHLEVEVGLRLAADLDAVPDDPLELAFAVEAFAAIEVVAARLAAFPLIGAAQLVADNVVGGAMVVGDDLGIDADAIRSLDTIPVELAIDGVLEVAATGAEALGHPLAVLTWMIEHARSTGQPLRAGDLVITGTCTGLVPARRGSVHVGRVGDAVAQVAFD